MLTQYQACVRWPVQCCAWLCHPHRLSPYLRLPWTAFGGKTSQTPASCWQVPNYRYRAPRAESRLGWDTILQHRSYKETAGSVGIAIYDNRVKIENPGTFPPNWDTEK